MPDAKVVVKQATKFVTQAQSGARAVNMPTAVSNNAAHGSRVVGGPSGHSTNNGQTRVAVIQTPPMRERVQPRPGVAPRPSARNPGGTRAAVIPTPMPALLTPLTVDQGMFLIHLVDSFMVAQKAAAAESGGTVPKDLEEIASATMSSLNAWTGALSSGAAQTTTATPTPAAPAVG